MVLFLKFYCISIKWGSTLQLYFLSSLTSIKIIQNYFKIKNVRNYYKNSQKWLFISVKNLHGNLSINFCTFSQSRNTFWCVAALNFSSPLCDARLAPALVHEQSFKQFSLASDAPPTITAYALFPKHIYIYIKMKTRHTRRIQEREGCLCSE